MLKKILYSLHRILGTGLSILFVIWFLSGFVMLFHGFPRVQPSDKYAHAPDVSVPSISIDSLIENLPDSASIDNIRLTSNFGNTILKVSTPDSTYTLEISANDNASAYILQYAEKWNTSPISHIDTLTEVDQWIPFGYLKKDLPIYKVYFSDKDKHQLYISSQTGEALQYTDTNSRFWAYLGAIPHWVYFTSLRQNALLWRSTIIWISGIGCIMCITGFIIGAYNLIKQYKRKKKLSNPYKKFGYKWHYLLGFVFGLFVFTFIFSGMMSLADVPQWVAKVHDQTLGYRSADRTIHTEDYKLNYEEVINLHSDKVKSIEWTSFGSVPILKAVIDDSLYVFDGSQKTLTPLMLNQEQISTTIKSLHTDRFSISKLTAYDNYYIDRKHPLPLPVYKVEVSDSDGSTYYINPATGDKRYLNTNSKVSKWMYRGLHCFNIKFLVDRPLLWNIVMWTTMIGGTLVSLSGLYLSWKYLKRKCKRKNK